VTHVPRWRIAAAAAVVAALLGFGAVLAPAYIANLRLQEFVAEITRSPETEAQTDDALRAAVLQKAHSLNLPVKADNVHIQHPPGGTRIDVRYFVRVTLPGYTVDLHF